MLRVLLTIQRVEFLQILLIGKDKSGGMGGYTQDF